MSGKSTYLFLSLGIFILLFLVHFFATMTGLYWITGWFDGVSHLIGGFGIFFVLSYVFSFKSKKPSLGVIITFSLLIGILWELFEIKYGITSILSRQYFPDTSMDLVCDIVGSCIAFLITRQKF
ncbi:MAG: hypothetical protein WCV55_01735 [Candidatus Paceibacterota bacterium]